MLPFLQRACWREIRTDKVYLYLAASSHVRFSGYTNPPVVQKRTSDSHLLYELEVELPHGLWSSPDYLVVPEQQTLQGETQP